MTPTRVYLSGPMSGRPQLNFPAFHAMAARLRAAGYEVWNPAEEDDPDYQKPIPFYARRDLNAVLDMGAIALLPEWEGSRGVAAELAVARWCGFPIYEAESLVAGVPKLVVVRRVGIEVDHG